jgi:hypothetical protein
MGVLKSFDTFFFQVTISFTVDALSITQVINSWITLTILKLRAIPYKLSFGHNLNALDIMGLIFLCVQYEGVCLTFNIAQLQ